MQLTTQKTLNWLRENGWLAEVVEHWNQFSRRRHDLFGFVDIVAVKHDGVLFVQCTSASGMSSRRKNPKIQFYPFA